MKTDKMTKQETLGDKIEFDCVIPLKEYGFWLTTFGIEGEIKITIEAKNWKEAIRLFKNFINEIKKRELKLND